MMFGLSTMFVMFGLSALAAPSSEPPADPTPDTAVPLPLSGRPSADLTLPVNSWRRTRGVRVYRAGVTTVGVSVAALAIGFPLVATTGDLGLTIIVVAGGVGGLATGSLLMSAGAINNAFDQEHSRGLAVGSALLYGSAFVFATVDQTGVLSAALIAGSTLASIGTITRNRKHHRTTLTVAPMTGEVKGLVLGGRF